jgi:hypothetical protein
MNIVIKKYTLSHIFYKAVINSLKRVIGAYENAQALGSRIFVLFNFINKMCIYNVYEHV